MRISDWSSDVCSSDREVRAGVGDATYQQMDVRVVCVPMIDGDPVQAGAKVGFHLRGEVARERAKVRHLASVFGRDADPEVVAFILRSLHEGQIIGTVPPPVQQPPLLTVMSTAVSLRRANYSDNRE